MILYYTKIPWLAIGSWVHCDGGRWDRVSLWIKDYNNADAYSNCYISAVIANSQNILKAC